MKYNAIFQARLHHHHQVSLLTKIRVRTLLFVIAILTVGILLGPKCSCTNTARHGYTDPSPTIKFANYCRNVTLIRTTKQRILNRYDS